jgi:hypothetical protein
MVTVTDSGGLTDTAAVTVNVTDVNEAPTAGDASFEVAEDSSSGTPVGTVSASDPDAGDALSYAITGGDPDGAFSIDAATGEISVADASKLDFEATPVFSLAVTVTDASGLTDTRVIPISVEPADAPPVDDTSDIPPDEEEEDSTDDSDDTDTETDTETETTEDTEDEPTLETSTETDPPTEEGGLLLDVSEQRTWSPASFASPEGNVSGIHEDSGSEELNHVQEARPNPYRQTEQAAAAEGRFAIVRNQQMMQVLDQIRQEMAEDAELVAGERELIVSSAEEVAVVFSAGLLGILLRGSSLAAVAVSALPVWRRVDPLAILALSDEERRKREEELRSARETEDSSEEAVGRLLD